MDNLITSATLIETNRGGQNDLLKRTGLMQKKIVEWIKYLILPIAILSGWQFASNVGWITPVTLPSPKQVSSTVYQLIVDGQLAKHIVVSIFRVLEGYGLAVISGIVLGIAIGLSSFLDRITDFIIQVIKPIPPLAWIPLAILWFGIGETSKIFIIFLGGFFPILINVIDGIHQTYGKLIEVSRVLEASRWRFVFKLVIPGAMPSIVTGLRVGIGSSWMCVVAAEMIAGDQGIGYLIMDGRQLSQPDVVIAGMISIGIIGKLMDVLLKKTESHLICWKIKYEGE